MCSRVDASRREVSLPDRTTVLPVQPVTVSGLCLVVVGFYVVGVQEPVAPLTVLRLCVAEPRGLLLARFCLEKTGRTGLGPQPFVTFPGVPSIGIFSVSYVGQAGSSPRFRVKTSPEQRLCCSCQLCV